jgi:lipopolysaccharide export LptBFGC system permease protein LptF
MLYYALLQAASFAATRRLVDPGVAAWLPNIGMIGLAGILFYRMR